MLAKFKRIEQYINYGVYVANSKYGYNKLKIQNIQVTFYKNKFIVNKVNLENGSSYGPEQIFMSKKELKKQYLQYKINEAISEYQALKFDDLRKKKLIKLYEDKDVRYAIAGANEIYEKLKNGINPFTCI